MFQTLVWALGNGTITKRYSSSQWNFEFVIERYHLKDKKSSNNFTYIIHKSALMEKDQLISVCKIYPSLRGLKEMMVEEDFLGKVTVELAWQCSERGREQVVL